MHTPNPNPVELPVHESLLHPITGEPLRAVGIVNGRTIWPIIGGSGEGDDANDSSDEGSSNDGGDSPDDSNADEGAEDSGEDREDDGDDDGDDDPDDDKRVRKANREAQRYRQQLRDTEQRLDQQGQVLEALRRALVGDEDGDNDEPDPEQLQSRADELQTENRSLRVQLAVYDIAGEHNGDPSALLDSRRFVGELDKLDPESETFRVDVAEAIKSAVERDGKLRADQGSSRGGADLPAGSGEGNTRKPRGIAAAVSSRYGG